ncbi:nucleotidyltransferase domain-containing protein [Thaumasiovibrio sp. DFM-14]|uniref:nucleotidyltransferase domain-containing protein n=1 Tax=Thaumasiovibrio sp. DFM-14 TaxID=3384792 RepID=UPI0039A3135B
MTTSPFQAEYMPLLTVLTKQLKQGLAGTLHSIYLSGSVLRGEARMNDSNLNMTLLLHEPLSAQQIFVLRSIEKQALLFYPFVRGIELKLTTVSDVSRLDQLFYWGFWFKHCCVCLSGKDIGDEFGEFEPTWEVAKAFNGDVGQVVTEYKHKITAVKKAESYLDLCQSLAKKLIYASFGLTVYRDNRWAYSLAQCIGPFLKRYPEKQIEMERLQLLARRVRVPKRAVLILLSQYGDWIANEYRYLERKFG